MASFSGLLPDFVYNLYLAFITVHFSLQSSENWSTLSYSLKTVTGPCTLTFPFQYLVPEWSTSLTWRLSVCPAWSLGMENGERKVCQIGLAALAGQVGVTQLNDRKKPIIRCKVFERQLSLRWKEQHMRILSSAILGFWLTFQLEKT